MELSGKRGLTIVPQSRVIEDRVRQVLAALDVPYELIPIDAAFADTASFCERYGFPLDHSVNTIIVGSKREPKQYCACLVLASRRLDVNHAVRGLMDVSRVSFASADDTMALTGMMIGGVTVFALPPELPIYVDATLMTLPWLILGSGSRSSKIKITPAIFERLAGAQIVPNLSVEEISPRT